MADDRTGHVLDVLSLITAGAALLLTLHFQYWQAASLQLAIGQQVFLNARPRIGLQCSIFNAGARAGTIVSGTATLDDEPFQLVMTSDKIETWVITAQGKRKDVAETEMTYFPSIVVAPRGSYAGMLWFVSTKTPPVTFGRKVYTLTVKLFDGLRVDPDVTETISLRLSQEDVDAISAPDNAPFDIPVFRSVMNRP
jgi:hypothetical protein